MKVIAAPVAVRWWTLVPWRGMCGSELGKLLL